MAYYFYHPLGDKYGEAEPNTYSGHGVGKLDIPVKSLPCYAMADGTITWNGRYSDGNTCIALETNCGVIHPVTFRYIHGLWDESLSVGTQVKRGQKLGVSDCQGCPGMWHLHIDMSAVGNNFVPIKGSLTNNDTVFHCDNDGQDYAIDPSLNVDIAKARAWADKGGGGVMGYNHLIFASKFVQNTGNSSEQKGQFTGDTYTFSDQNNYNRLIYNAYAEEGVSGVEGIKWILSVCCNHYETHKYGDNVKGSGDGLANYCLNRSHLYWVNSYTQNGRTCTITDEMKQAADWVLKEGNRSVPKYVMDYGAFNSAIIKGIASGASGSGGTFDRNSYVSGQTHFISSYGGQLIFYGFAASNGGIFCYQQSDYDKWK